MWLQKFTLLVRERKYVQKFYALYNNKIKSDISVKIYTSNAVGVQRREG